MLNLAVDDGERLGIVDNTYNWDTWIHAKVWNRSVVSQNEIKGF